MGKWIEDTNENKNSYTLDLLYEEEKPDSKDTYWYSARVRKNGCIEFTRYFNEPMSKGADHAFVVYTLCHQIHLCDIDEAIKILEELKEKIKNFIDS